MLVPDVLILQTWNLSAEHDTDHPSDSATCAHYLTALMFAVRSRALRVEACTPAKLLTWRWQATSCAMFQAMCSTLCDVGMPLFFASPEDKRLAFES